MIEELPDLPFRLILSFLSYADQFSLRRTCKKLKCLINEKVRHNLFVILDGYPSRQYLFHSDELVYYSDSCRVTDFNRFILSQHRENLKLLRKLVICFESMWRFEDYPKKVVVRFLQEPRLKKINLEHLNFFEQIEHLEIKGVGKIIGKLSLRSLRILSVEARRLSEFDLQCGQLKAMRIMSAARPNFVNAPHDLDYLSTGLLYSDDTYSYLLKLYGQCPRLFTIGFEYPGLLRFTLEWLNAGHISLANWRVVRLERSQHIEELDDRLVDCFVVFQKSIEPDGLRVIFNDESISSEDFISIIRLCRTAYKFKGLAYLLGFLKRNPDLNCLASLFSGANALVVGDPQTDQPIDLPNDGQSDDEFVMKLKYLRRLYIYSKASAVPVPARLNERLFQRMLTTFTQLEEIYIENPVVQVGQVWLEQMPNHWPNVSDINLREKPESIKFIANFKNLRSLIIKANLTREEISFLMQTTPSLCFILLLNEKTDFITVLSHYERRRRNMKQIKALRKILPTNLSKYGLNHHRNLKIDSKDDRYSRNFDSLEELLDYYYDHDIFNATTMQLSRTREWTEKKAEKLVDFFYDL